MRAKIILVVLVLAFIAAPISAINSSAPQPDSSIENFWTKFKTAVTKGDKTGIAGMSGFPIEMPYGHAKIKTKAQLLKRYRELFNVQANAVKCFADAVPAGDAQDKNRFTVGCKDRAGNEVVVYGFAKKAGVWKLVSLDNINE